MKTNHISLTHSQKKTGLRFFTCFVLPKFLVYDVKIIFSPWHSLPSLSGCSLR